MAGLTAEQIIERIANANGVEPAIMRQQIEQALQVILADTTHPHCLMLADLFPEVNRMWRNWWLRWNMRCITR